MKSDTALDFSIVIPALNAGSQWIECLKAIKQQTVQPQSIIVIDSSSNDSTVQIAEKFGCQVISIKKEQFGHGKTRQMALDFLGDCKVLVFMTQDAVLANIESLRNLVSSLNDPRNGAAYGCQLPGKDAKPTEVHARQFNYPNESVSKSLKDVGRFGVKLAFLSNAFAAYRLKALNEIGGFPQDVIMSEDTFVGAKLLLTGYHIAYCADATVYHYHNYNLVELFQRYFDIGVFNGREKWIQEKFGKAEKEGSRYIKSQIHYLLKNAALAIPLALTQTAAKWLGYKLGYHERLLPNKVKRYLSMHKAYWALDREN